MYKYKSIIIIVKRFAQYVNLIFLNNWYIVNNWSDIICESWTIHDIFKRLKYEKYFMFEILWITLGKLMLF